MIFLCLSWYSIFRLILAVCSRSYSLCTAVQIIPYMQRDYGLLIPFHRFLTVSWFSPCFEVFINSIISIVPHRLSSYFMTSSTFISFHHISSIFVSLRPSSYIFISFHNLIFLILVLIVYRTNDLPNRYGRVRGKCWDFCSASFLDQEMVGLAGPQSTLCPRAGIPVPASQGLRVRAHLFGQLTNHSQVARTDRSFSDLQEVLRHAARYLFREPDQAECQSALLDTRIVRPLVHACWKWLAATTAGAGFYRTTIGDCCKCVASLSPCIKL